MIRTNILSIGMPREILKGRGMRKYIKETMLEVGKYWHEKMLPRHFEPGAANRYKYKKRTIKHIKTENRMVRAGRLPAEAVLPLVYTGKTRRQAKRAEYGGTAKKFSVKLRLSNIYKRFSKGKPSYLPAEITKVTHAEEKILAKVFEGIMAGKLNRDKTRKKVRAA